MCIWWTRFGRTHLPFCRAPRCTTDTLKTWAPRGKQGTKIYWCTSWRLISTNDTKPAPTDRCMTLSILHFYFESFNRFVSSALTSSSTCSKVITRHHPPSCSLHTTHTQVHLLKIYHTNLMSDHTGEFITVFCWIIHLEEMEIIVWRLVWIIFSLA